VPKAFAANHLPFVGFTYSRDYQLLSNRESSQNSVVHDTVDVGLMNSVNNKQSIQYASELESEKRRADELQTKLEHLTGHIEVLKTRETEVSSYFYCPL